MSMKTKVKEVFAQTVETYKVTVEIENGEPTKKWWNSYDYIPNRVTMIWRRVDNDPWTHDRTYARGHRLNKGGVLGAEVRDDNLSRSAWHTALLDEHWPSA